MRCTHSNRPGRLDRKRRRGCGFAGKRRFETRLCSESLEGRALLAVNVFDIGGTWRRGLSDPGVLSGTLSVDTDTGRVSDLNLLRTGGIKENTGYTVASPTGPKLLGGTPLPDTIYGIDSITFQGIKGGQYRIETTLRGGYSMVASWQLPTGSLSSYAGGAVTVAFTSNAAFAMSNPGSGTLSLRNRAPFEISLSPSMIPENSPAGTRVGLLATSDPDPGDTFTYTLLAGGTDNASFQIAGNELRSKAVFDFEAKRDYSILVRSTDRGGLSKDRSLAVTVMDVNEAPTSLMVTPPRSSLAENTDTTRRIKLTDIAITDDALGTNVLTLTGVDAGDFEIDGTVLYLKAGVSLDYETKQIYEATVKVGDPTVLGSTPPAAGYTLNVTDVPEDDLPRDFLPGVPDQLRRDAWQAYRGDNKIDRREMIDLLRKTGDSDGVVTGPEVAGLRRITGGRVGNRWEITMDDYVRNLARKVVEENPANRLYQGSPLGSLNPAGGSTALQMNTLVGKWFEGKDLPSTVTPLNPKEATYRPAAGQLFVDSISWTDVREGRLSDCYFLASLAGVAETAPQYIRDMFIDNGDGTWTVGFFNPDPQGSWTPRDYVTVDRRLPTNEFGQFVFANIGGKYDANGNELWVALAEKAYAQWAATGALKASTGKDANAFQSIEWGCSNHAVFHVTGAWPTVTGDVARGLPNGARAQLDEALKAGQMVLLGTKGGSKPNGEPLDSPVFPFTQAHVYFAPSVGPRGQNTYRLVNPYDSALTRDFLVTWDQLAANFNTLLITGTRGAPGAKEFVTLDAKYVGWKPDVKSGGSASRVMRVALPPARAERVSVRHT